MGTLRFPEEVVIKLFTTGYTLQPYGLADPGMGWKKQAFHATCALIRHPRHGYVLFDTGYAPRFRTATSRLPFWIYGALSPVVVSESLTLRSQLEAEGIQPKDLQSIILSHFHADHVAGLRDFEGPSIIASSVAWQDVRPRQRWSALSRGFVPSLLPEDISSRLQFVERFDDVGLGPFERSHDLFGDGTLRLIELPGHARGQIGALIRTSADRFCFLAADATWTLHALRNCRLPHPLTFSFIDSVKDLRATLQRLNQFAAAHPEVDIVPTHCPEIANRYGFDEVVRRLQ